MLFRSNGCSATTNNNTNNNTLVFNPLPALPVAVVTQPNCINSTGGITVASPGVGTYTYKVVSGNFSATNSSGIFNNLTANTSYDVSITNSNTGCTSPLLTVNVDAAPALATTPTVSVIDPTCAVATGTISITSLGANYTYSINGIN